MGLLVDEPAREAGMVGEGEKFVRLYADVFDDEDRAMLRSWVEEGVPVSEVYRRLCRVPAYKIGRSSVERGLHRLKAAGWDSSKA